MTFSQKELQVIWAAINTNEKNEQRTFPLAQLTDASKIAVNVKTNGVNKEEKFLESAELEFSTDEKKLIRDVTDRPWPSEMGEAVLSVREKLA